MELVWIEDFIELAATRNFSVAAAARNITQPAFSRRVRALENWVGAELIDRGSYPVQLTRAGETFLEASRGLAREIHRLRDDCRRQTASEGEIVNVSALHSIALSIFPSLIAQMSERGLRFHCRMKATDFHDCIEALALDRVEIAFSYAHAYGPAVLQTEQFLSKKVMTDPFLPVSPVDSAGSPRFQPGAGADKPVPFVSYSSDCYLGKMQAIVISQIKNRGAGIETVFENSMSETIKRMVLAGAGIGFLPRSTIASELAAGQLKILDTGETPLELDVVAFRKKAQIYPAAEKFWHGIGEEFELLAS